MSGHIYIERILAYRPSESTGSAFLDAVAELPFDKHDVIGALTIAEEALGALDEGDSCVPFLQRVMEFKRRDQRYDKHDMEGILHICGEAAAALHVQQESPSR